MRLATRRSPLALAQVELVERALGVDVVRVLLTSDGDTAPAHDLVPGAFTRRVDAAVLAGEADAAVHSLKDLPVESTDGLVLAAILPRGPANDVLVVRGDRWQSHAAWPLPYGARVGTSSARRAALLAVAQPDAAPVSIRGNVQTRLNRLADDLDAVVLAEAGLARLGWPIPAGCRVARIALGAWPCAPGQAAIAVHARADDAEVLARLATIDHAPTRAAVARERDWMRRAGVGCHSAFAAWIGDGWSLGGLVRGCFGVWNEGAPEDAFLALMRGDAAPPHTFHWEEVRHG